MDEIHKYMLLGRMQDDCKYCIENASTNHLWAGAGKVEEQIEYMFTIYKSFGLFDKPKWIKKRTIKKYKRKLLQIRKAR